MSDAFSAATDHTVAKPVPGTIPDTTASAMPNAASGTMVNAASHAAASGGAMHAAAPGTAMRDAASDAARTATGAAALTALHLVVNNHPGVMSHVCGLFARRAFNLEGILVTPVEDGATCDVWLIVNEDRRIVQIVNQVKKLHDVLDVRASALSAAALQRMAACLPQ